MFSVWYDNIILPYLRHAKFYDSVEFSSLICSCIKTAKLLVKSDNNNRKYSFFSFEWSNEFGKRLKILFNSPSNSFSDLATGTKNNIRDSGKDIKWTVTLPMRRNGRFWRHIRGPGWNIRHIRRLSHLPQPGACGGEGRWQYYSVSGIFVIFLLFMRT